MGKKCLLVHEPMVYLPLSSVHIVHLISPTFIIIFGSGSFSALVCVLWSKRSKWLGTSICIIRISRRFFAQHLVGFHNLLEFSGILFFGAGFACVWMILHTKSFNQFEISQQIHSPRSERNSPSLTTLQMIAVFHRAYSLFSNSKHRSGFVLSTSVCIVTQFVFCVIN